MRRLKTTRPNDHASPAGAPATSGAPTGDRAAGAAPLSKVHTDFPKRQPPSFGRGRRARLAERACRVHAFVRLHTRSRARSSERQGRPG